MLHSLVILMNMIIMAMMITGYGVGLGRSKSLSGIIEVKLTFEIMRKD